VYIDRRAIKMPYEIPTAGYDPLFDYTPEEIEQMYVAEGIPLEEARERSKVIAREIIRLNRAEQRLWKKVRKHEQPSESLTLLID
jgi:hypothetical protein